MTRLVSRLRQCRRATAAVEFAFVLPVMLTLYGGIVEISNYISTIGKLREAADEMVDFVSKQPAVCDSCSTSGVSPMTSICSLAAPIFQAGGSVDLTTLTIEIFDTTVPTAGSTSVTWEATRDTSASNQSTQTSCKRKTSTDTLTLPPAITSASNLGNTQVNYIVVEMGYTYSPLFSGAFLAKFLLPNEGGAVLSFTSIPAVTRDVKPQGSAIPYD